MNILGAMNSVWGWEDGHCLKPNGVGDFNLFCPQQEERIQFVPVMVALMITRGSDGVCPNCGKSSFVEAAKVIEPPTPAPPNDGVLV